MSAERAAPDSLRGWPPPVLDPAGPFAAPLHLLTWVLVGVVVLVMLVVLLTLGVALFGPREPGARPWAENA
jgi:cytochrome c oxidase subunit 2